MSELPQDAVIVKDVLQSMGVTEYEPRVLQQLMDFMYRYTSEILQDAEAIGERGGAPRGEVALPDVMLAVQSRAQHSFVQPPSQQMLSRLAEQHNRRPLPDLRQDRYGLRLPPETDCLLAPNYQLQPRTPDGVAAPPLANQQQRHQQQAQPPSTAAAGGVGARRDHRIDIRAPQSLPAAQLQQEPQQPESRPEGGWVDAPTGPAPSVDLVAAPPAGGPAPAQLGPPAAPVVGQAAGGGAFAAGQEQHAQQQAGPNDDLEAMLFEDI
ncbi:hypothetical protein N2152v2_003455 [Parachlorella kessleri]